MLRDSPVFFDSFAVGVAPLCALLVSLYLGVTESLVLLRKLRLTKDPNNSTPNLFLLETHLSPNHGMSTVMNFVECLNKGNSNKAECIIWFQLRRIMTNMANTHTRKIIYKDVHTKIILFKQYNKLHSFYLNVSQRINKNYFIVYFIRQ